MKTVINSWGTEVCFEAAVALMDDSIREDLAFKLAPCTDQEFFDAYCKAHKTAFGEPWALDEANPIY